MPLIYITGVSGSGKSSIRQALKDRGYEAYGTDEDGIGSFYDRITDKRDDNPDSTNPEFRSKNAWKMRRGKVEDLRQKAKTKNIYLCGAVENDNDIWGLFTKVIALIVDDETIKHRLATRITNNFGQNPDELNSILRWNNGAEDTYRKFGAEIVDATQPLEKVVDEILAVKL